MTSEELRAFIEHARTECDAALARLATIDPTALPPDLKALYERQLRNWELRRMTADDVVALHEDACRQAGRELTPDELRGLIGLQ